MDDALSLAKGIKRECDAKDARIAALDAELGALRAENSELNRSVADAAKDAKDARAAHRAELERAARAARQGADKAGGASTSRGASPPSSPASSAPTPTMATATDDVVNPVSRVQQRPSPPLSPLVFSPDLARVKSRGLAEGLEDPQLFSTSTVGSSDSTNRGTAWSHHYHDMRFKVNDHSYEDIDNDDDDDGHAHDGDSEDSGRRALLLGGVPVIQSKMSSRLALPDTVDVKVSGAGVSLYDVDDGRLLLSIPFGAIMTCETPPFYMQDALFCRFVIVSLSDAIVQHFTLCLYVWLQ